MGSIKRKSHITSRLYLQADRRNSSKAQYEAQLKDWNIRKNLKLKEWQVVLDTIDKLPPSMDCRIMMCGREVKDKTIRRARRRLKSIPHRTRHSPLHNEEHSSDLVLRNIQETWIETRVNGEWCRYDSTAYEGTLRTGQDSQENRNADPTSIFSSVLPLPSLLPQPVQIHQPESRGPLTVNDNTSLDFGLKTPNELVSESQIISNSLSSFTPDQISLVEPGSSVWQLFISTPDMSTFISENVSVSNQLPNPSFTDSFTDIGDHNFMTATLSPSSMHVGGTQPSRNTMHGNDELGINTGLGSLNGLDSIDSNGLYLPASTQVGNLSILSSSNPIETFILNRTFWKTYFSGLPSAQLTHDIPLRLTNKRSNGLENSSRSIMWNHQSMAQPFLECTSGPSIHQPGAITEDRPLHIGDIARKLMYMLPGQVMHARYSQPLGAVSATKLAEADFEQAFMGSLANGRAGLEGIQVDLIGRTFCHPEIVASFLSRIAQMPSTHTTKAFMNGLARIAIESNNHQLLKTAINSDCVNLNEILFQNEHGFWWHTSRRGEIHSTMIGSLPQEIGALEYAVENQFTKVAEILLNAGLQPRHYPQRGFRGAEIACDWLLFQGLHHYKQDTAAVEEWTRLATKLVRKGAQMCAADFNFTETNWSKFGGGSVCHLVASRFTASDHSKHFIHGTIHTLAKYLLDDQATKVSQMMISDCEVQHELDCLRLFQFETNSSFMMAAERGHHRLVKLLIPHTTARPSDIICYAIRSKNPVLIDFVLSKKPVINEIIDQRLYNTERSLHGLTSPFAEAIMAENWSLMKRFQQPKVSDFLWDDEQFRLAIEAAADVGDYDLMKAILNRYPDSLWSISAGTALEKAIEAEDDDLVLQLFKASCIAHGKCLYAAIKHRNPCLVRRLLNTGIKGGGSLRTLQMAFKWGDFPIITDLLSTFEYRKRNLAREDVFEQIDPSNFDYESFSAKNEKEIALGMICYEALSHRNSEMIQFSLDSKLATTAAFHQCFLLAFIRHDDNIVRRLIKLGLDGPCDTALGIAAQWRPNILQIPIQELQRPRTTATKGNMTNILKMAIRSEPYNMESIKLLLGSPMVDMHDTGETVGYKRLSRTPLGEAIESCRNETHSNFCVVNALLDAGYAPNSIVEWEIYSMINTSLKNQTALLKAIETVIPSLVELLIDRGANVNQQAHLRVKRTPLQKAVEVGNYEIVRLLLDRGAGVNDDPALEGGGTALQFAAIKGNCNMAAELLQRGANLYAPPSRIRGRWPLEGAAEHGRLDMIEFLWRVKNDTSVIAEGPTGFEERHCLRAMQLAVGSGHSPCKDMIAELSGVAYKPRYPQHPIYLP